ncbi:MAG: putative Prepilin peptidase [Candidatus Saccharibacteria bacterium]|nr:putative Prepilin peptidase [Candidatus Saccharibacteria bacterium]
MVILILVVWGLCFGSFVNALVWRIHEQSKAKTKKARAELSIMKGRSMCPHCKHTLGAHDLLPVISWLSLGGKCRYCHKPIAWQYPVVELITALLFVASYLWWPYGFDTIGTVMFAGWLAVLIGLVALTVYDLKWMLLPNRLTYPLMALWSVVIVIASVLRGDVSLIVSSTLGVIFCGGIFWVLYQVSDGRWIGGGDVKLGFLLGLIVGGPLNALFVIFIASLIGTFVALPLMALKKVNRSSQIPFGPYLIVGGVLVFLFHEYFVQVLNSQILLP